MLAAVRVAVLPTCLVDAVAVGTGVATIRLLRRLGHEVTLAEEATCCGQPAWNSGHRGPAATVARATLDALDALDVEAVVLPAGSCTTMIRVSWPELLGATARLPVYELSEFLTLTGATAGTADATPAVYHRSCHMLRELRIEDEPERLLDAARPGRVPTTAGGRCCGFGGMFSVKLPETSTAMADDVLDAAVAAGAREVVGCDPSCLLHLGARAAYRGLDLTCRHLAEILADAR